MSVGWIKLHRKIQESAMYKALNSKQRDVMMQCLLLANHDDNEWEWGAEIFKCKSGQFITSLESLSRKCGSDVKVQSVRTALLKLEKWGFLTNESTKTGRLITICKWATYQHDNIEANKDTNKQLTKSQQRANKELTTNKNVNNDNNVKNDKEVLGPHPTIPDCIQFFEQNGATEQMANKFYHHYNSQNWEKANGRPIAVWQSAAKQWIDTELHNPTKHNKPITERFAGGL